MSYKFSLTKIFAAGIVLAATAVSSMSAFAYDYIGKGTVTGGVVNIRSAATTESEVVGTGVKGTDYSVISQENGWAKIETTDGIVGYMNLGYFSVSVGNMMTATITGSAVNVREGAGTEYSVIGTSYKGQSFPVLGRENGWYKISFNDISGFVSGEYVSLDGVVSQAVSRGQQIVNSAKQHLGKAYVYGASGPNAFDCSGFTSYIYKQFGYSLNRTASGQYSNGVAVSRENLQPGDLVMFTYRGMYGIGHVGIYMGDGKMVHAGNSSTGVVISDVFSGYYGARYVGARRIV
ncbi:MAG: C40 family peptidase [Clostridia bacterium]|nr:C40 family peptidase [Clostridia bacterium]